MIMLFYRGKSKEGDGKDWEAGGNDFAWKKKKKKHLKGLHIFSGQSRKYKSNHFP